MLKKMLMTLAVALLCAPGFAAVLTESVTYQDDDTELEGFLAYSDERTGPQPAVLIVHEWWGLTEHAKNSAKRLAELGYTAFALDMYGKGQYTDDPKQAAEWSGQFKSDSTKAIQRFKAGMDILREHDRTDPSRMAAIGYCFGGTMVLEMARLGFAFQGVVSFHGGLGSNLPDEVEPNKDSMPRILVCHGADDPFVPKEEVDAFHQEMKAIGCDWQFIAYGGAVHSFTSPAATGALKGAKYHEQAAKRSWEHMKVFFEEILK